MGETNDSTMPSQPKHFPKGIWALKPNHVTIGPELESMIAGGLLSVPLGIICIAMLLNKRLGLRGGTIGSVDLTRKRQANARLRWSRSFTT